MHLEWLAKMLALFLLCDYQGQVYMLYDNRAVQLCGLTCVKCHFWLDRLAKYVLAL